MISWLTRRRSGQVVQQPDRNHVARMQEDIGPFRGSSHLSGQVAPAVVPHMGVRKDQDVHLDECCRATLG